MSLIAFPERTACPQCRTVEALRNVYFRGVGVVTGCLGCNLHGEPAERAPEAVLSWNKVAWARYWDLQRMGWYRG